MLELRSDFLTVCTLMEVTFPEMEQWREEAKHDAEANKVFYAKQHPDLVQIADLMEEDSEVADDEDDVGYDLDEPTVRQKVGRNDPCPCGSGKKFKKCCLNKQRADGLFDGHDH